MAAVIALLVGAGLTGCGGSGSSPSSAAKGKHGGTLRIIVGLGSVWQCTFNPYISVPSPNSQGFIYEPLVIVNSMYKKGTGVPREYPWLASSYKWSKDNSEVRFTIRTGVKWTDGQPMSAADVAYTFDLLKKYPALDTSGVWQWMEGVRQEGNNIVVALKPGGIPGFATIASHTFIVPKHIWEKVADPVKYVDSDPVGTGPFLKSQCSPQSISWDRNPNYWQPGKPYIDKVVFPDYIDAAPGNRDLVKDDAAWGGMFMPDVEGNYIAKDPENRHIWYPPSNNLLLVPNLKHPILSQTVVRQAMSYAIDRSEVSQKAEFGYMKPANQTGVLRPLFDEWYNADASAKYDDYSYDPAKATSLLEGAGFKRGSDGILRSPDGTKLSFSVIVVGGFTDVVAGAQVIASQLKKIGIELKIVPLSYGTAGARLSTGDFELSFTSGVASGVTPYTELRNILYSANSAPIGKPATSNTERWESPATDALIDAYARTTNVAAQKRALNGLQEVMLKDVPVIPVLQAVHWEQYSNKVFTGWPSEENPYAIPAPYMSPDLAVVLTTIRPK